MISTHHGESKNHVPRCGKLRESLWKARGKPQQNQGKLAFSGSKWSLSRKFEMSHAPLENVFLFYSKETPNCCIRIVSKALVVKKIKKNRRFRFHDYRFFSSSDFYIYVMKGTPPHNFWVAGNRSESGTQARTQRILTGR